MSGTKLQLINCAKTFPNGTQALFPTDVIVEPGEILGLLGPSGCGKTTMLRIMAGLEMPNEGSKVCFDEEDVTRIPIEKRSVGMVFQSYALFPNMSVRENVGYGLKVKGMPKQARQTRVDEVLAFCRLDGLSERAITQLSGGQRQRVALARAVAPKPRILLLDEPLSALDAALRDVLRDELAAILRDLSMTAIFVTHDQAEAMAIADTIAVMNAGKIEQRDTPESLYRAPKTAFVATFVGGANRLEGRFAGTGLQLPGGTVPLTFSGQPPEHTFVRQEDVTLVDEVDAKVFGTVTGRIFLGTHYKLTLNDVCADPICISVPGTDAPKIGARVGLHIPQHSLIQF